MTFNEQLFSSLYNLDHNNSKVGEQDRYSACPNGTCRLWGNRQVPRQLQQRQINLIGEILAAMGVQNKRALT